MSLVVVRNGRVLWNTEIGGSEVGKQWRLASSITWRYPSYALAGETLGSIQVTCIALCFAVEKIPSRLFVWTQYALVGVCKGVIEFRRECANLRRGFVGCNGECELVIGRV